MTMNKNIVFVICFLFYSLPVLSQFKWEIKKQTSGITIYTSDVAGSEFKAFKGVTTISASHISEVVAPLVDVPNAPKLFPDTKESKYLKKSSDGNFIQFQITEAPWPVDDREGVFEIKSDYNKTNKEVIINIRCIKYDYPVSASAVRMSEGGGFWKITEINKGVFEVTYQYHANPAGKIPPWLANSFVVDNPFITLQNLKSIIAGGKYKNATLDFVN